MGSTLEAKRSSDFGCERRSRLERWSLRAAAQRTVRLVGKELRLWTCWAATSVFFLRSFGFSIEASGVVRTRLEPSGCGTGERHVRAERSLRVSYWSGQMSIGRVFGQRTSGSQGGSAESSGFEGASRHVSPTARAFSPIGGNGRQRSTGRSFGSETRNEVARRFDEGFGWSASSETTRWKREGTNTTRGSAPETVYGHAVGTRL